MSDVIQVKVEKEDQPTKQVELDLNVGIVDNVDTRSCDFANRTRARVGYDASVIGVVACVEGRLNHTLD